MAQTMVKDVVIWTKHIHGVDGVKERVAALQGGEVIDLTVDGFRGPWRRMSDGGDGRPTLGVRPIGQAKAVWSELYTRRRGEMVRVEVPSASGAQTSPAGSTDRPGYRVAARAALLKGLSGYSSDGRTVRRDDLHERDRQAP